MKIIYVHQYFSTPSGATGIRSYQMARQLTEKGHSVLVICGADVRGVTGLEGPFLDGARRGMVAGIEVVEFDLVYSNSDRFVKRSFTFFRYAYRTIRLVLTERFDLLFATTTPLTTGLVGIVARFIRRKPFVFEVRDLWPELPAAMGVIKNPIALRALSLLEWVSYHAANRLIGLSPGIVDGIARRRIDRSRIAMIPNGCDLEIFQQPVQPWRPDGVSQDDLLAVFAGAHGIANGLDSVIDAGVELQRRGRTDIKIAMIGTGKMKGHLQDRARTEHLNNVVFLDPVGKERLAGLLRSANVGLQVLQNIPAFQYGTSPNKFFDYLAAGLPVIVNYPGWVADLIIANDCGLVAASDGAALAAALARAADNRADLRSMGRRSLTLAQREFDRHVLADRFVSWLEGAVA
jgi:glycosyltransferase involved in cell wall biosynthesis